MSYKLQQSLLKQEIEHDEIYEDKWKATENERLPYVKNDVSTTSFCYARYTTAMEKLTNFGMKNCLALPSLANKYINNLGDENDEPMDIYTDLFLTNFVRNSIKRGTCNAFNQYYISEISDEVFSIFSKERNVGGNICDLLGKHFEFLSKYEKLYAKNFESKFEDNRDIIQNEKTDYNNNKLNMLSII